MLLNMFLVYYSPVFWPYLIYPDGQILHLDILSRLFDRHQGSPTAREGWPENMVGNLPLRNSFFEAGSVMHHFGGSCRLHAEWSMTYHQCMNHEA